MSDTLAASVVYRFIDNGEQSGNNSLGLSLRGLFCGNAQSSGEIGGRLIIMKGAVPTDFTSITTFNSRASDNLVIFDATSWDSPNGTNDFSVSQTAQNPALMTSLYRTAVASGTATWFMIYTQQKGSGVGQQPSPTQAIVNAIIGTVGTVGSGADLEVATTSIVAGQTYRVYNMRLQLPATWTY
jgi:hypothetical protein